MVRRAIMAAVVSLPLWALMTSPAHAQPIYKLTASYGVGEFQASGEWLCVDDTKADGHSVKIKLSWYENGYREVVRYSEGPGPGTCSDLSFPEGKQMLLTLSRRDGSGAISRTVYA